MIMNDTNLIDLFICLQINLKGQKKRRRNDDTFVASNGRSTILSVMGVGVCAPDCLSTRQKTAALHVAIYNAGYLHYGDRCM